MKTHAWISRSAHSPLDLCAIELPPLPATGVRIRVSHCGVCYSDIDALNGKYGPDTFPMVAGHEVVGQVIEIGSSVDHLQIGDRVGAGPYARTCLRCEPCLTGNEVLCSKAEYTTVRPNTGGFGHVMQLDANYAFPIPAALDSAKAAPLLCAGLTVYSPLKRLGSPRACVGVVGIGGLGHLALQFGNQLGYRMIAISRGKQKQTEALQFGAKACIDSDDTKELGSWSGKLDLLISTATADLNWNTYLQLLGPNGTLCLLGIPPNEIAFQAGLLIGQQRKIVGSIAGGRALMREMLSLAAEAGIGPTIETFSPERFQEAIQKVQENRVRYRAVIAF